MNRNLRTWSGFAVFLAVLFGAMGWLTLRLLAADREAAGLRLRAVAEEDVRLALWRMDSLLVPFVGRESARPPHVYEAFYPAPTAYTHLLARLEAGDVIIPSPLLAAPPPEVLLHFQIDSAGAFSSPQVPTGNLLDLVEARYDLGEERGAFVRRLRRVEELLDRRTLLALLPAAEPEEVAVAAGPRSPARDRSRRWQPGTQSLLSFAEQQARAASVSLANDQAASDPQANPVAERPLAQEAPAGRRDSLTRGAMRAFWTGGALFLARQVRRGEDIWIQGVWLDWEHLRHTLLEAVQDLLPEAALEPLAGDPSGDPRALATIPVRLEPGEVFGHAMTGPERSVRLSLVLAWVGAILAAAAAGLLVRGILALSERRGAFVSAVTHELRTPLTTFRLYTEMLEEGMVQDPGDRRRYLGVLRAESERLGHLVENVLAYARLERARDGGSLEGVEAGPLLDRVLRSLEVRAEQGGMELRVTRDPGASTVRVLADPAAVERILYNLVDNACKYAAASEDRAIELSCGADGRGVRMRVRDHGPGIPAAVERKLFRPFSRSAREAAGAPPGVGLGLSLSRRLARRMRGDLRRVEAGPGACFELFLVAAPKKR
ncbi:MAG: HAMP domain-containing histidine kinase [Deltaproteobacteria bacterium]|nr:HAMP domain-containing histidine kinase [Deltaproteobacteria bacterium]